MTILFAQNKVGDARFIKDHLLKNGNVVVTAHDTVEAFTKVEHLRPDVIITDLVYASTFSFISKIKNTRYKKIPILVLSEAGQEKMIEEALDLGADDYLVHSEKKEKLMELTLRINLLARGRAKAAA